MSKKTDICPRCLGSKGDSSPYCVQCNHEYNRAWREAHKQELAEKRALKAAAPKHETPDLLWPAGHEFEDIEPEKLRREFAGQSRAIPLPEPNYTVAGVARYGA